jgi:hypothetical protein
MVYHIVPSSKVMKTSYICIVFTNVLAKPRVTSFVMKGNRVVVDVDSNAASQFIALSICAKCLTESP